MTTVNSFRAVTAATVAALLLSAPGSAADAKSAGLAKGKEVFEQCSICHSATTNERKMGPSLKGLYKKEKLLNGSKVTDEAVLTVVNKGKGSMPAFGNVLSAEEKTNLLNYLKSL